MKTRQAPFHSRPGGFVHFNKSLPVLPYPSGERQCALPADRHSTCGRWRLRSFAPRELITFPKFRTLEKLLANKFFVRPDSCLNL